MDNNENKIAQNKPAAGVDQSNQSSVSETARNTGGSGDSPVETAATTAKDVISQAKDSAGQAYGLAAKKATSKIEEQKTNLSSGLSGIADSIRQVGKNLREENGEQNAVTEATAKYGETIAAKIEDVSAYLEKQDLKTIIRDVEFFARRQPAIFIGASFALGLLAARFLKSSGATDSASRSSKSSTGGRETNNRPKLSGQTSADRS